MAAAEQAALAVERLMTCKKYMHCDDIEEDDELIAALLDASDGYIVGAGVDRETSPAMFDLIAYNMTLRLYEGRDDDVEHAATDPMVRKMLTQLKLRCAYGGA